MWISLSIIPFVMMPDIGKNFLQFFKRFQNTFRYERMQLDFLKFPYHQAIINDQIPLSIGGGIGQSRTSMLLLKKAHLGEVSISVWPKVLKDICRKKNIHVLE